MVSTEEIGRVFGYLSSGTLRQRSNAFKNILIERTLGLEKLNSFPSIVQIEVTNRCNLRCEMCSRYWTEMKTGDLNEKLIPRIEEILPFVSELSLFGYGEPLLSTAFFKLLELSKNHSSKVSFFTNGVLLTKQNIQKILEANVSAITISLDAANPKTFKDIRRGAELEKIVSNIKKLNAAKKSQNLAKPDIRVEFVAMAENIEELPELIGLVAKLEIKKLRVSNLVVWDKRWQNQSLLFHQQLMHEVFEKAKQKAKALGIQLDLPVDLFAEKESAKLGACFDPWVYAYIRFDGIVQACCYTNSFEMGDLNKQHFKEIWNNQKYQMLRKLVNSKTPLNPCLVCEKRFKKIKNKKLKETYLKFKPRQK